MEVLRHVRNQGVTGRECSFDNLLPILRWLDLRVRDEAGAAVPFEEPSEVGYLTTDRADVTDEHAEPVRNPNPLDVRLGGRVLSSRKADASVWGDKPCLHQRPAKVPAG